LTAAIAEPPTASPFLPTRETPEPKASVLEFLDMSEPAVEASETPPLVPEETVAPPEEAAPVSGLISQEFIPPNEATYRLHPELTHEFVSDAPVDFDQLQVETAEQVELQSSGASEFRVPNAAEDFMESAADPPPGPPEPVRPAPVAEPARQSYSVSETKGQSVAAFFQGLLAARPPGSSSSPGNALEGAHPSGPTQDAPAPNSNADLTSSTPTVPASTAPQDAAVSFDDFFGAAAAGSGPPKGGGDPSKDDLDQFQSWLQNLKP
jgi:hypothetical protein